MKRDVKALEELLNFLIKDGKGKKEVESKDDMEEVSEENSEEMEEMPEEMEDLEEIEEDVRPLPGENRKKGKSFSITQLGFSSMPKKVEKKKGKK